MQPRLYVPTSLAINWFLVVAFASIGQAIYLRYHAIENAPVSRMAL